MNLNVESGSNSHYNCRNEGVEVYVMEEENQLPEVIYEQQGCMTSSKCCTIAVKIAAVTTILFTATVALAVPFAVIFGPETLAITIPIGLFCWGVTVALIILTSIPVPNCFRDSDNYFHVFGQERVSLFTYAFGLRRLSSFTRHVRLTRNAPVHHIHANVQPTRRGRVPNRVGRVFPNAVVPPGPTGRVGNRRGRGETPTQPPAYGAPSYHPRREPLKTAYPSPQIHSHITSKAREEGQRRGRGGMTPSNPQGNPLAAGQRRGRS